MEITRASWQSYISKLSKINKKAAQLMTEWIDANGYGNIENMIAYANAVAQKYGEASASLACEMYDAIAEASGVSVPTAVPAEVMPEEYLAKSIREAAEKAPTTIPNCLERVVKMAGADTTLKNAKRDGAEFAWIPSGDSCAFCIMLASNGWQKANSKSTNGGHAEHIHNNCNCNYAIRFNSRGGVSGFDYKKYKNQYEAASGGGYVDKINSMRRENYAQNRDKILEQKRIAYKLRTERNDNST